jgi:hypothetical protein
MVKEFTYEVRETENYDELTMDDPIDTILDVGPLTRQLQEDYGTEIEVDIRDDYTVWVTEL